MFWHKAKNFDWYYEFSDDHSVWLRGNANKAKLKETARELGDEAVAILEAWSKHFFTGESWGTDKAEAPPMPEYTRADLEQWATEVINSNENKYHIAFLKREPDKIATSARVDHIVKLAKEEYAEEFTAWVVDTYQTFLDKHDDKGILISDSETPA